MEFDSSVGGQNRSERLLRDDLIRTTTIQIHDVLR